MIGKNIAEISIVVTLGQPDPPIRLYVYRHNPRGQVLPKSVGTTRSCFHISPRGANKIAGSINGTLTARPQSTKLRTWRGFKRSVGWEFTQTQEEQINGTV